MGVKSFKSLLVLERISLNIISPTKFNWILKDEKQSFLLPSKLLQNCIESKISQPTSFPYKASPVCHLWFTGCVCSEELLDTLVWLCLWKDAAVWHKWLSRDPSHSEPQELFSLNTICQCISHYFTHFEGKDQKHGLAV